MLTRNEVAILAMLALQPRHVASVAKLANALGPDTPMRISHLNDAGYTSYTYQDDKLDHVMLLPSGFNALEAYRQSEDVLRQERSQQERKEHLERAAQDERQRKDARRSWIQWSITTILTIVSFFAGAIVEKLTGLVELISHFFN